MKKLFFLAFVVFIVSCTTKYKNTKVIDPKEFTTIKMVSNIDTIAVSVDTLGGKLYQIENGVATRVWVAKENAMETVLTTFFLITLGCLFGIFIIKD